MIIISSFILLYSSDFGLIVCGDTTRFHLNLNPFGKRYFDFIGHREIKVWMNYITILKNLKLYPTPDSYTVTPIFSLWVTRTTEDPTAEESLLLYLFYFSEVCWL